MTAEMSWTSHRPGVPGVPPPPARPRRSGGAPRDFWEATAKPAKSPIGRNGRPRQPCTLPGYNAGVKPRNAGRRFPPEPLTEQEVLRLLEAIPTETRTGKPNLIGIRNRALFTMLWRTGLRVSEAVSLRPHDVDPPARRSPICSPASIAHVLDQHHYLGAAKRGFAWSDEFGVMVLGNPASRSLPHDRWIELTRWCLNGTPNGGSQQWARVSRWLYENKPEITTVVSYSDPGVGHTGALYRACNWLWAPTWLRLRPPPSGNGSWTQGKVETVKDRWVFPLRIDDDRERVLQVNDAALKKRMPEAEYREPKIRRGRVVRGTGGGAYQEVMHTLTCDLDDDCTCRYGIAA